MSDLDDLIKRIGDPIEFLIAHFFDIIYREIRLNTFKWASENLEQYWSNISGGKKIVDDGSRETLTEYVRYEMIFTNMELAEDLVRVLKTYRYGCPDRVATYRSSINAKSYYQSLEGQKDEFFIDILSIQPGSYGEDPNPPPPKYVEEGIHKFRDQILKIADFYDRYYDLYNQYKHGNRLAYMTSPEDDGTNTPFVVSFPILDGASGLRNQIKVNKIYDVENDTKIGYKILGIAQSVKNNWKNQIDNHRDFKIDIPT